MLALPRYALAAPAFRFRALVTLAERLPLGGEREVALATWMAARLLWELGAPQGTPERRPRAMAARQWGQSLAMPVPARVAFQQVTEAVARDDRAGALAAWQRLLGVASRAVDASIRSEARQIEARLSAPAPPMDLDA